MKRLSEVKWNSEGDCYAYCGNCRHAWVDDLPMLGNLTCPHRGCFGYCLRRKLTSGQLEAIVSVRQQFPEGWDQQRVKELIGELDARTDEEWAAADEASKQ